MNAGNARDLHTSRLLLRIWRDSDLVPLAAINADPLVAEHLPAILSREESDALVARIRAHWQEQHGFAALMPGGGGAYL